MNKLRFAIFLLIFLFPSLLFSSEKSLHTAVLEKNMILLGTYLEVLEDKKNALTIEQVRSPAYSSKFFRNNTAIFSASQYIFSASHTSPPLTY